MNKRNSFILGLLFMLLIVEVIVLAPKDVGLAPEEPVATVAATPPKAGGATQVMHDVHLVEAKSEGKEWELWATQAMSPKEGDEWSIERVKVRFFADNGVTYTVTGEKGNVAPNKDVMPGKSNIRISGHVVTRSSNGYVFKTESVFYDSVNRRLMSPQEVEMTGPPDKEGSRLSLTGADMVAEFASNEITVNRDVRARRRVKDDKIATIRSERAVFSGRSNSARFFGNVVIDMETMRVTGPEAKFIYDSKSDAFESVHVDGGVRMTDTDKFATSNSVNVEFKKDRMILSGAPRVVQNGDELVGDEIVFLEGGRKVQVSNAKAQIDPNTMEKMEREKQEKQGKKSD